MGENVAQAKKILKHIQKENRKIRIYVNGKGNSTIKSCLKIPYHLFVAGCLWQRLFEKI